MKTEIKLNTAGKIIPHLGGELAFVKCNDSEEMPGIRMTACLGGDFDGIVTEVTLSYKEESERDELFDRLSVEAVDFFDTTIIPMLEK